MVFLYIQKTIIGVLRKQDLFINMFNINGKIGIEYTALVPSMTGNPSPALPSRERRQTQK